MYPLKPLFHAPCRLCPCQRASVVSTYWHGLGKLFPSRMPTGIFWVTQKGFCQTEEHWSFVRAKSTKRGNFLRQATSFRGGP